MASWHNLLLILVTNPSHSSGSTDKMDDDKNTTTAKPEVATEESARAFQDMAWKAISTLQEKYE